MSCTRLMLILVLALPAAGAMGAPVASPNILLLLADDLRADTLGCANHPFVRTPTIDSLARHGTRFRNAFVTTSICAVSRASIFAGQYARRHGIEDFKTAFTAEQWSNTYPALLRARGFRTGFIGKFGVGNLLPTNAFDYWDGFPGQGRYFAQSNDASHLTHDMGESALTFLRGGDLRPFCLSISFKAPHAQDENAVRPFPPDPADEALYADARLATPGNYSTQAFNRLPPFAQNSEGHVRWLRRFATPEQRERNVKDYYRLVTGIDREVGRILDALTELGLATNTIIVFTSDNGFFLGERGLSDKFLMYEESIRVPLIVFDPFVARGARGRTRPEMALNIDVMPTLLDYAGVPFPSQIQGWSLRPLVEGRAIPWRHEWFYEHHYAHGGRIPESEGVRTDRWKYVRYTRVTPSVEELYDLQRDPDEMRNLASSSKHQWRLRDMRADWSRLRDHAR